MPLTQTEINAINEIVKVRTRMSAKQLVELLEDSFVDNSASGVASGKLSGAYDRSRGNEVHTIYKDRKEEEDATRQREKDSGFKIRTKAESAQADSRR